MDIDDNIPAASVRASEPRKARTRSHHGSTVVAAMTSRERVLTAGVLVLNLTLGAWLVQKADFSGLRPNDRASAEDSAAQNERPTTDTGIELVQADRTERR